ncbi:MAG: hypothetical protein IJD66_05665 [Methanocorpusculum sp.]|nr:hypothetical protein [Methanocorpusculum sp.]
MKLTKTASIRLMALSGLLPLLYIITRINRHGYPLAEPTFPQLILLACIVILTAVILVSGIIGGVLLTKKTESFSPFGFTLASGIMFLFILYYVWLLFNSSNPLSIAFSLGDIAGFSFGFTAIFYAVFLSSVVGKENRKLRTLSIAYGVFSIITIIQFVMTPAIGDSMDVANAVYPAYYSLFTMDAVTVTCIFPAILGILLLIFVWKADLFLEE